MTNLTFVEDEIVETLVGGLIAAGSYAAHHPERADEIRAAVVAKLDAEFEDNLTATGDQVVALVDCLAQDLTHMPAEQVFDLINQAADAITDAEVDERLGRVLAESAKAEDEAGAGT